MRTQIPRIACTCGIEFRLIGRSIIKSWPPSVWAINKKKKGDTRKRLFARRRTSGNDDDARARFRWSSSPTKMDRRVLTQKDCRRISQIFLSVERSRATSAFQSLIFLLSHSRVAILARSAIFPLTLTRAERARGCTRRCSRNFLGLQPCVLNVRVHKRVFLVYGWVRALALATGRQWRAEKGLRTLVCIRCRRE